MSLFVSLVFTVHMQDYFKHENWITFPKAAVLLELSSEEVRWQKKKAGD